MTRTYMSMFSPFYSLQTIKKTLKTFSSSNVIHERRLTAPSSLFSENPRSIATRMPTLNIMGNEPVPIADAHWLAYIYQSQLTFADKLANLYREKQLADITEDIAGGHRALVSFKNGFAPTACWLAFMYAVITIRMCIT